MTNLYWPVYKNIEKEIVELSNHIHFDDTQVCVYSVKISELLIRCAVEIEAIAKDLYKQNGGKYYTDTENGRKRDYLLNLDDNGQELPDAPKNRRDLFFDTDCIAYLENIWSLSKKKVLVSASNFYFNLPEHKILTPLKKANKRGTSSSDWLKAYQAVKHNRSEDLKEGNIKHLLRAAAGLFLLNLYYKDDIFELSNSNKNNFSEKYSEIFDIKVHTWHSGSIDSYFKKEDFEECVYFTKWTNDYKNKLTKWITEQNKNLNELIFNHPNVLQHLNDNFIENGKIKMEELKSFWKNREYFKCFDMQKEYGRMLQSADYSASEKTKFNLKQTPAQYEAVLNKNQEIYPQEPNLTDDLV